jgi:hypothetical protein
MIVYVVNEDNELVKKITSAMTRKWNISGEVPLYITALLTAGLLSSSDACGGKIFLLYAGHLFGPEPKGINAFRCELVCMQNTEGGKYAWRLLDFCRLVNTILEFGKSLIHAVRLHITAMEFTH